MLAGSEQVEETYNESDWSGNTIEGVTFDECVFIGGTFTKALFEDCRFLQCEFRGCDFSVAKFPGTRFRDVRFVSCKLSGVDFLKASPGPIAIFDECRLDYAGFSSMDLRGTQFLRCTALETDFAEARMEGVDCAGTDFAGARFSNTDLRGANFLEARNYSIDPQNNKVKKAIFDLPEAINLLRSIGVIIE